MSFQLNGFGSQSTSVASHFATSFVLTSAAGAEDEEFKESSEKDTDVALEAEMEQKMQEKMDEKVHKVEEQDIDEEVTSLELKSAKVAIMADKEHLPWQVDESLDGIGIMSDAFVDTVRPSLDATIHRLAELKESQERLLIVLTEQNAGIQSNKHLEDAAAVLDKLPFYAKKLQEIKLAMQEISASSERMSRRAENLRIDAQSYAIKKENKRDEQTQWNKLYAAKSSEASDQN